MPIAVLCPTCSARLNAPDSSAGKKVKCPKCQNPMMIPGPAAPAPPPPPSKPAPPPPPARAESSPFDFDAAASSGRKGGRKRAEREEPLDLDDEPAPKRGERRRPARDRDRDDEEVDDDRPRRQRPAKKGGPPLMLVLVLAGVFGLLCIGGVGVGAYYLFIKKDETASGTGRDDAGGGAKAAVPTGWKEFSPPNKSFRAYFPDTPKSKDGPPRAGSIETKMYLAESKDKLAYIVCEIKIPKETPPEVGEKATEAMVQALTRPPGSKEISRRETTLAGKPASEIVVELPPEGIGKSPKKGGAKPKTAGNPTFVARIMKTDTAIYFLMIGSEDGRPKPELENGFFDNFDIVK